MNPDKVLAGIETFAGARVVCGLGGGPASDSYLIECGTKQFVLRIDTAVAAPLRLDRSAEVKILEFVSQNNIGPRPEFVNPEQGILITRFVEGRAWSEADLQDPTRIKNLATLLWRLHALEPIGPPFDLHDKIQNYAQIIGTAEGRNLADEAQRQLRELNATAVIQCLCHNDLICANIIEGQGLALIDWEYAAIGDPFFDLATIAEHHGFNQKESDGLLTAYFGKISPEDNQRLSRYRSLYKNLVTLWLATVEQVCGRDLVVRSSFNMQGTS